MSKTYQVDESFILEAHKAACNEWKTKIENKFPELFELYKVGDKFMGGHMNNSKYILAGVGENLVCFINLNTGRRWSNPIKVDNMNKISKTELQILCEGGIFEKI